MQALTADEIAILKSRFQAGVSGHRQQVKLSIVGEEHEHFLSPDVTLLVTGHPIIAFNAKVSVANGGDDHQHIWTARYLGESALARPFRVDSEISATNTGVPSIAHSFGHTLVLYVNPDTSRFALRVSLDDGISWGDPSIPVALATVVPFSGGGSAQLYKDGDTIYLFYVPTAGSNLKYITTTDYGATWSASSDTGLNTNADIANGDWFYDMEHMFKVLHAASGTWMVCFIDGSAYNEIAVRTSAVITAGTWSARSRVDWSTGANWQSWRLAGLFDHPTIAGSVVISYNYTKSASATVGGAGAGHRTSANDGVTWSPTGQENAFPDSDNAAIGNNLVWVLPQEALHVPRYGKTYAWGVALPASVNFNIGDLYGPHLAISELLVSGPLTGGGTPGTNGQNLLFAGLAATTSTIDVSDRVISISIDKDASLDSDTVNIDLHNEDQLLDINTEGEIDTIYRDLVLADGPTMYWRLGEASGATAADSSGNGRDASYNGGVEYLQPQPVQDSDKSIKVTLGYVQRVTAPLTASLSWELWAKSTDTTWNNGQLLGSGEDANGFILHSPFGTRDVKVYLVDSVGVLHGPYASYTVADITVWHYYAFTYDGVTVRSYLDGVEAGSTAVVVTRVASNLTNLWIGRANGSSTPMKGGLDEVAMYGTVLSADKILAHYNAGVAQLPPGSYHDYMKPNVAVDVWQWHGDVANKVQTFHGILDSLRQHDSPRTITITARDGNKKLLVQEVRTIAPQDVKFDGSTPALSPAAIRTPANFVFLNKEVNEILKFVLRYAGVREDKIALAASTYTFTEIRGDDGQTLMEFVRRVCTLAGLDFWCDELGIYRTRTYGLAQDSQWTFRAKEDITTLDPDIDDDDLKTRVRIIGRKNLGALYLAEVAFWPGPESPGSTKGPAAVAYDKLLGAVWILTQNSKLYLLNLDPEKNGADGVSILSGPDTLGAIAYPDGITVDPADNHLWVSDGYNATTGNNANRKFRKINRSTFATIAGPFTNPDGDHCAITAFDSGGGTTKLLMTTFTTKKLYLMHTDGTTESSVTVNESAAGNPTGVAYDLAGGDVFLTLWDVQKFFQTDFTTGAEINAIDLPDKHANDCDVVNDVTLITVGSVYIVFRDDNRIVLYEPTTPTTGDTTTLIEVSDAVLESQLGEIRRATITDLAIRTQAEASRIANRQLAKLKQLAKHTSMGAVGNPGLQKFDRYTVFSPSTGLNSDWVALTIRADQDAAAGTYLMVVVGVPYVALSST